MSLSSEDLLRMYRYMLMHRGFEEKTFELLDEGKPFASPHAGFGHEAIAVGAYYGLRDTDYVKPHYRERAAWFIRGIELKTLMAEHYGKQTSTTKGKYNYLHPWKNDILPSPATIGCECGIPAGVALAIKLQKKDSVVVCGFGDACTDSGLWYEALNYSAIWKLPIVYVCNNNGLSISTPLCYRAVLNDIASRGAGFGMPCIKVEGDNVLAVYKVVQEAVKRARAGDGPTLIDAVCARLCPHNGSFRHGNEFRSKEQMDDLWKKHDPVEKFKKVLIAAEVLTEEKAAQIYKEVEAELEEAVKFAEESPYPKPESTLDDVYETP